MLRRYASCAQERDLDEGGIGLVVLHVVSAGDRVHQIARIREREVMIELVCR
jgi:hypothetical protein